MIKILEILRIAMVSFGVFWAYYRGTTPEMMLNIMLPWVIVGIAGFSGFEGLFFGKQAATEKGFETGSNYQRQSAFALLSYATIALVVYFGQWGNKADLTIMLCFMFFMVFSSVNHAYSAFVKGNRKWANINRPFLTLGLIAAIWYPVYRSLF